MSVRGSRPSTAHPTGNIIIPILGMTCRACERRIERQVRRIRHVEGVVASASRSRVEVTTIGPVSGVDLAEAIEAAGYEVGRAPWITHDARAWLAAAIGLAVTLHKGENVIELPPLRTGRIQYSCSMGMYGGQLTVVDGAPAPSGGPGNG